MKHLITRLADIPETGSKIVPFFGREVHVYFSAGKPCAVANVCLHFGGPLECKDGKFVCPWHGATYDMNGGSCLKGPAPRTSKLLALSTIVEDGGLYYVWGEA